jgi:hypothetical protein
MGRKHDLQAAAKTGSRSSAKILAIAQSIILAEQAFSPQDADENGTDSSSERTS